MAFKAMRLNKRHEGKKIEAKKREGRTRLPIREYLNTKMRPAGKQGAFCTK